MLHRFRRLSLKIRFFVFFPRTLTMAEQQPSTSGYKTDKKIQRKRKAVSTRLRETTEDLLILAPKEKAPPAASVVKKARLTSYPHVNNLDKLLNDAHQFSAAFHSSFRNLCNQLYLYVRRDDSNQPNLLDACGLKVDTKNWRSVLYCLSSTRGWINLKPSSVKYLSRQEMVVVSITP